LIIFFLQGLDRFLAAATGPESTLLETSAGVAKYEHVFHSLVWRIPRLPKEGQGEYFYRKFDVIKV
jgi:hypothetical protein